MARAEGVPVRVLIVQRGAAGDALALAVEVGEPPRWTVAGNVEPLPAGVVFDPSQPGVPRETVEVQIGSGEPARARYYHITANGTYLGGGPNFVVGLGVSEGDGVKITDPKGVDGFRLTAAARPFFFRSVDEVGRELPPAPPGNQSP